MIPDYALNVLQPISILPLQILLYRPFLEMPIRRPMIIDKKVVRHSARHSEILIKVGLHISTIICVDDTSTLAVPKNIVWR